MHLFGAIVVVVVVVVDHVVVVPYLFFSSHEMGVLKIFGTRCRIHFNCGHLLEHSGVPFEQKLTTTTTFVFPSWI